MSNININTTTTTNTIAVTTNATDTRRDNDLLCSVIDEMNWDTGVDAERIHVRVSEGVVTLTGDAYSFAGKMAAQEAAHRVLGVQDVANDIEVHPIGLRGDTEIAHAVRHALKWHAGIPHETIDTTVEYGFVTLQGSVYRLRQRSEAEDAVRNLVGVRGVTNLIRVEEAAVVSKAVREAICGALKRQAGRESERIRVSVASGGVVTVTGSVGTWAERRAILGAAGHAPGVASILDRLTISASA